MRLKTNWDLSALDISQKNLEDTKNAVATFAANWKTRSDYLQNPEILLTALNEFDNLTKKYGVTGDAGYYWGLRHALEQNNAEVTASMNKIDELGTKLQNDIQFFTLKLSKIDHDKQSEFLNFIGLANFKHFLERVFKEGKYTLSEPEEKILNLKSNVAFGNWVKLTETLLGHELYKGKTFTQLMGELRSNKKSVRDKAVKGVDLILAHNVDVAEHELNSVLADKKINDELRGVSRPDFMRHLADDIDTEVVDALVKVVSDKFDIAKRFYALKAKALKVPKLKYHERLAPVGKIPSKYDYEKACKLVSETFAGLDPEFGLIFDNFTQSGQIDVYPKRGKRDGAFCASERLTTPTYVMLNHTDKLQDVLTIAHEVGHGINNELMRKGQKLEVNFGSPFSTAEVASTFMEDFVLQKLLTKCKPAQKFALLMQKLDDDVATIFRQVACYKFEFELHNEFRKKGYLSKQEIGKLFQKHMAAYMGDFVEQPKGDQNWWVYWSHIRNYFYVYSYASGLLISKSLQAAVKKDPGFISKVKEFLGSGGSKSPAEIFLSLGVDISDRKFWISGLDEIELLLDKAERLWKEVKSI